MGRRSRGRGKSDFLADGVLLVDKPAGPTSHDVVDQVRRRFRPAKLGHVGTLDPFATGLLVLAVNRMTRLADLLGAGAKVYRGRVALGAATDTGDPTGQVTATGPVPVLDEAAAAAAVCRLVGRRMQAPPAYSAVKHQGRPLYSYARQGVEVSKEPRPIEVHWARLTGLPPGEVEFELCCSKGTYVRSLAEDLALALGTEGHLASLTRLASEPFSLEDAVDLDDLRDWSAEDLEANLLAPVEALARAGLGRVELGEDDAWQIRQGQLLERHRLLDRALDPEAARGCFMALDPDGELAAVLRWLEPGERRPGRDYESIRVFPAADDGGRGAQSSASAFGAE